MTTSISIWTRLLVVLVLACTAVGQPAAQPVGADGADFLYRTVQGDTLTGLAERFTAAPSNWKLLQELNAVAEPTQLPIARLIRIPFALIPLVPATVQAQHVAGEARADGTRLAPNAQLDEGATIATGQNGFLTLRFNDDTLLTLHNDTAVLLERIRAFKGTGLIDSILTVKDGSVESDVAPRGTGVGRFEIRTPVSVTGVRGTRLRVHNDTAGSRTELLTGRAHLEGSKGSKTFLSPGQGAPTDASGALGAVRPLLPKPDLTAPQRSQSGWTVSFPPVAGATAYRVVVADDPNGAQPYSSEIFDSPPVTFNASGAGNYYVVVRAIDADGLMGEDAARPFEGRAVLRSSDGSTVMTASRSPIFLSDPHW